MKTLEETVGGGNPLFTKSIIKMALHTDKGCSTVWVVVEDSDDIEVYQRFLNKDNVKILISEDENHQKGCANVEAIVTEIKAEESSALIFGIRDADYTCYEQTAHIFPADVFVTDHRDIEMMMLAAPSVKAGLFEWNTEFPDKITEGEPMSRKFGYMRICNHLKNSGCNFKKNVKISLIWNDAKHSFIPDWERMILSLFICNCGNKAITEQEFNNLVDSLGLTKESMYNVCQGHDVLDLLQYMMIHTNIYNAKSIRKRMVNSYSKEDFASSKLYQSIDNWSKNNKVLILI